MDGYIGLFEYTGAPNAPTNLQLVDNTAYIGVNWTLSDTTGVSSYEIWRSDASDTDEDFNRIIELTNSYAVSNPSMKYADYGHFMPNKGVKYYRVYALMNGIRSSVLSGSLSYLHNVGDVRDVIVSSTVDTIILKYTLPDDNRLDYVQIRHYASDSISEGEGSKENELLLSTLVYAGPNDMFTYNVISSERSKWHKFWISTVTKENIFYSKVDVGEYIEVAITYNINVVDISYSRESVSRA